MNQKCEVCNSNIDQLSGFCDCTEEIKYIVTCHDCDCTFEETDYVNNPDEKVVHVNGLCDECFEWEVVNLK